jgi:2-polyprenyl-3-methyl-5-hydroxy-6-metoxy-1,4-benzoquinol methylase
MDFVAGKDREPLTHSDFVRYGWDSKDPEEAHSYLYPAIEKLLLPLGGQGTILDCGCGNGSLTGKISRLGFNMVAIDASEDGIALAREAYPGIKFEIYSVYDDLRKIIAEVDAVIATELIEHLYRPKLFCENVRKILRPGGLFILSTPYHGYWKNLALSLMNHWDQHFGVEKEGGHIKFFSPQTLAHLLTSCGFGNITFHNVGRVPWLWKSMVCRAEKCG